MLVMIEIPTLSCQNAEADYITWLPYHQQPRFCSSAAASGQFGLALDPCSLARITIVQPKYMHTKVPAMCGDAQYVYTHRKCKN